MSLCFSSKETPVAPKEQEITPADLFEMVGKVGERMLVNRARLLLMQHETEYNNGMLELNLKVLSYFFLLHNSFYDISVFSYSTACMKLLFTT